MMTVRFPTGFSVQYNDAKYVTGRGDTHHDLFTSPDEKGWVARVHGDCIIETQAPCRIYQAIPAPDTDTARAVASLHRRVNKVLAAAGKARKVVRP